MDGLGLDPMSTNLPFIRCLISVTGLNPLLHSIATRSCPQ
uniref:Uncharacterized protein n=1 Tax=Arundo donax TaxID=35708 RepID=A0A0A8ZSR2_ARUDO